MTEAIPQLKFPLAYVMLIKTKTKTRTKTNQYTGSMASQPLKLTCKSFIWWNIWRVSSKLSAEHSETTVAEEKNTLRNVSDRPIRSTCKNPFASTLLLFSILFFFCLIFIFQHRGWTQGFSYAKHILYHWATSLAPAFNSDTIFRSCLFKM